MGLRDILEAATPGPWHVDYGWDEGPSDGPSPHGWVAPHGAYSDNRATNQLIALAPELAALVLDMGDYLRLREWRRPEYSWEEWHCGVCAADESEGHTDDCPLGALLARLDQLGKEEL